MHQSECDLLCWMPFPNMAQVRQNLTIAATGASGAIFTRELLRVVECDARITTVNFIASDNALRVFAEELEIRGRSDLLTQLGPLATATPCTSSIKARPSPSTNSTLMFRFVLRRRGPGSGPLSFT